MESEKKYTFLGASDAALSMFIEIVYCLDGNDFDIQIVKNVETEKMHEYLIPGLKATVIADNEWLRTSPENIIIGVNKAKNKQVVFDYFNKHHKIQLEDFTSLIHPSVEIAHSVNLGDGVIINPNTTIAPFAHLKNLVTVNRNVSIGHHTEIANFCTIHPGANVAGHCKISEGVTIGMGANVIDGVSIGKNSFIGAGSLVTKDIPPNVIAYGFPAKVIKSLTKNEFS